MTFTLGYIRTLGSWTRQVNYKSDTDPLAIMKVVVASLFS